MVAHVIDFLGEKWERRIAVRKENLRVFTFSHSFVLLFPVFTVVNTSFLSPNQPPSPETTIGKYCGTKRRNSIEKTGGILEITAESRVPGNTLSEILHDHEISNDGRGSTKMLILSSGRCLKTGAIRHDVKSMRCAASSFLFYSFVHSPRHMPFKFFHKSSHNFSSNGFSRSMSTPRIDTDFFLAQSCPEKDVDTMT